MKTKLSKLFFVCISCFCVFHISAVLLYNLPINPMNFKMAPVINSYVGPIFKQNWHLFAPDPVSTNNYVLARASFQEENQTKHTEWINISKTYTSGLQKNRFNQNRPKLSALRTSQREMIKKLNDNEDFFEEKNVEKDIHLNMLYNIVEKELTQLADKKDIHELEIKFVIEEFPEYGKDGESNYRYYYIPDVRV
ncbi:DUF5819 family protein [Pontibacillus yanchengensis]|uniref:Uncharacterized protein n=1 Tax=Pontibacillus yanchengensis Y32 TaxID=1385514 RepID=A0A0A2TJR9_9BACI|nr:DUF5819 family protein [Pontibacillus yanchengensis]KGP74688.1 hypothetical protein N782_00525 [Pontibacillus yanchengensis Y32]